MNASVLLLIKTIIPRLAIFQPVCKSVRFSQQRLTGIKLIATFLLTKKTRFCVIIYTQVYAQKIDKPHL